MLSKYTEYRSQNDLLLQLVCSISTGCIGCIFWKRYAGHGKQTSSPENRKYVITNAES